MISNIFFVLTGVILYNTLCNAEYSPIPSLDLPMYMGTWYQVYKDKFDNTFQGGGTCAVAEYSLTTTNVTVLNSQIDKNGNVGQISGYAFYENGNSGGQLTVDLDGVPVSSPYWVIEIGPIVNDKYEYSIVSDDNRLSLFVLARNVSRYYNMYDDIVQQHLLEYGFTNIYNKPIPMIQNDCDYSKYNKV